MIARFPFLPQTKGREKQTLFILVAERNDQYGEGENVTRDNVKEDVTMLAHKMYGSFSPQAAELFAEAIADIHDRFQKDRLPTAKEIIHSHTKFDEKFGVKDDGS